MKKMITVAAMALAAAGMAAPAHADNDSAPAGSVNGASDWNFTAAAVCTMETAVAPILGDYVSDHTDNCSNGNLIDGLGR
ncbi:hypothetical protein ACFY5K_36455 [Streptomyces griseofuscus]|uniref:hypothetical protein n=1 Tax=Streptomyces griseofuscus TaxID=146922 RepID=UPI0036ABDAC6